MLLASPKVTHYRKSVPVKNNRPWRDGWLTGA